MSNDRIIGEDDIGPVFAEDDDSPRPDRKTGGPAFPVGNQHYLGGMSLRDYFAAQALSESVRLLTDGAHDITADLLIKESAVLAYRIADEMLKARGA